MGNNLLSLAGLGSLAVYLAPMALVATFWGQIRNWFAQLRSYIVTTVSFSEDDASRAMLDLFWKDFKRVGRATVSYSARSAFVIPRDQYEHVGLECVGQNMIFRRGWRFIFVQLTRTNDDTRVTVNCLRGVFNLESLYLEALDLYNQRNHTGRRLHRYQVNYRFGSRGKEDSKEHHGEEAKAVTGTDRDFQGTRILRYTLDEIGEPVDDKPFSYLAYPREILDFLDMISYWKQSEKWFKSKHLPYRMGALLKGGPGTGKSSFVKAMAQEVDLPIEIFDLTTFTNEDMVRFWNRAKERTPVIVLFEDVDRLFDEGGRLIQSPSKFGSPLTLDSLLNCISGVLPSDGILTIATANFPERLDPALTRPGRLDRILTFSELDDPARELVANRILSDCPEFIEKCVREGIGETGAQFTKRCGDIAIKHFWEFGNSTGFKKDAHDKREYNRGAFARLEGLPPPRFNKQPLQSPGSKRLKY